MNIKLALILTALPLFVACSVTKKSEAPQQSQNQENKAIRDLKEELVSVADRTTVKAALLSKDYSEVGDLLQSLEKKSSINAVDEQGQTTADVLWSLNDNKKLELFIAHGLSIYKASQENLADLLRSDELKARKYLARFDKNQHDVEFKATNPGILAEHNSLIASILNDLKSKDSPSAILRIKTLNLACDFLTKSLVLNSIAMPARPSTSDLVNLIKKANCSDSLNSADIRVMTNNEAIRQFQDRFNDVDLYMFLISRKNHFDRMVDIGTYGVKISTELLFYLARFCTFDPEDIEESMMDPKVIRYAGTRSNNCFYHKDVYEQAYLGECKVVSSNFEDCLLKTYSYKKPDFNFSFFKDGKRIMATTNLEYDSNLTNQILAIMYNYNNTELDWLFGLDFIYSEKIPEY